MSIGDPSPQLLWLSLFSTILPAQTFLTTGGADSSLGLELLRNLPAVLRPAPPLFPTISAESNLSGVAALPN